MPRVRVDPRFDPLWRDLVDRREGSVFHSPAWSRVLTDTYDLDVGAHVHLDADGKPQAGLLFARLDDVRGERIVSLPFSDYCDFLGDDREVWNSLLEPHLGSHPFSLRCLHNPLPLADERFVATGRAKWHGLDLRPDLDSLWLGLHGSARRAVRKARAEGVQVRQARDEAELRAFYDLHLRNRKYKFGLLTQPYSFFAAIWRHFVQQDRGALLLASCQDRIIAGTFFLQWRDRLYYKFNASASSRTTVRPNDLLVWEGVRFGRGRGLTQLDFGLSDWNQEGLLRYKRKFASEEKTITFLRCAPEDALAPERVQIDDLLHRLTGLFTDESVPDSITEKAGEALYKLFA